MGGGHNPSLIALGVLGVMMMAAVIGVVEMDDDKVADAAIGDTFSTGGYTFKITGDGEVTLTKITKKNSPPFIDLTIPSTVSNGSETFTVTSIEITTPPADDELFVDELIIPDTVTYIGPRSFYDFRLGSVTIPGSVKTIGDAAFSRCNTNVDLSPGIEHIGNQAFYGLIGGIGIPDGVISIGDSAFARCINATRVTIPDSVQELGTGVFSGCYSLTKATLSANLTSIPDNLFSGTSLESITIPENVTSIGNSPFGNYLKSITFTSANPPSFGTNVLRGTVEVYTPGWDPTIALADAVAENTTIIWANPPVPDLTFLSDPVTNGTLAYNPLRTSKTALTA